jgi:hypothetical protein
MSMMPRYESTKNTLTDAIANVYKLFVDNKQNMGIRDVYNYDTMSPIGTPALSVVFDNAKPTPKTLGTGLQATIGQRCGCNLMAINLILYYYFETLNFGNDNYRFIEKLGDAVNLIYTNSNLYGLCHSEPMEVTNITLGGRRLNTSVVLTGVINLSVPVRF